MYGIHIVVKDRKKKILARVEVRDSRTGYLLPVRDAQGTLPDVKSCLDTVAAVAVAVAAARPAGHPRYKFTHPKLKYKFKIRN